MNRPEESLARQNLGPIAEHAAGFVPVDPGEKGPRRSRNEEDLFGPDDPVLNAYLEAGHGCAIPMHGDLAALDADDPKALAQLIEQLPDTAWQVSGSRRSEHYFLRVPSLTNDIPLQDPDTGENIGHIKAAPQSVVIAPGSRHPSGNHYGPLHGEHIAEVSEDRLRELLDPFTPNPTPSPQQTPPSNSHAPHDGGGDCAISVTDVLGGGYSEGKRVAHPVHGSDTGTNFMVNGESETFRCWRHDATGNGYHLIGMQAGIIDCGEWVPDGLDRETWSKIFNAAEERGFDTPGDERTGSDNVELCPLLPTVETWDWRAAGRRQARDDDTLTLADVCDRTRETIADAYRYGDNVLIDTLPASGKSHASVAAVADTRTPVLICAGRGHVEQYDQYLEWCREYGLSALTLPSFHEHCPTANGEHSAEWRKRVGELYQRGVTGQDIHKHLDTPCQRDGTCPYSAKWQFDPDDFDVLIGHPLHAHVEKATAGRAVVFDESTDAFETALGGESLTRAITAFLQGAETIPFEDYTDLVERRHDPSQRADALLWFEDHGVEVDSEQALSDERGHAAAPLAAYTLLVAAADSDRGGNLGNGWEWANLGNGRRAGFNREANRYHLLAPPNLDYTRAVVALDGTPTREMWEPTLGRRFNHRQVLTDAERREYIRETLRLDIIQTETDAVKPYGYSDHVNVRQDAALLAEIHDRHGQKPDLITSKAALRKYETADEEAEGVDVLAHVNNTEHRGNVRGSNQFKYSRLGAIIGSGHYGDDFVKKWGAFTGRSVETPDRSTHENRGLGLSYGEFGDKILYHMREAVALQELMRFGRDGNGATVYAHTAALPEWLPLAGEGRVVATRGPGERQVLEAAADLNEWTTTEIANHPAVDITVRQVFNHLETLTEGGVIQRQPNPDDRRGYVWTADGLRDVNDYGVVELDRLLDEEVAEVARLGTYTWSFRNYIGPSVKKTRGRVRDSPPAWTRVSKGVNHRRMPPTDTDAARLPTLFGSGGAVLRDHLLAVHWGSKPPPIGDNRR